MMSYTVPVKDKVIFIRYFLRTYELKSKESAWILNYLLRREERLENVYFVSDITNCPRALMIATTCSDQPSFQFYKQHVVTSSHDKAYHDIRFHPEEPLYIQLSYERSYQCPKYVYIVEENPYLTEEDIILPIDEERTERLLQSIQNNKVVEQLKVGIDEALDNKDEETFLRLTKQLSHILQAPTQS